MVRDQSVLVTACRNGKYITHIVSHFKVIDPEFQEEDEEEEDDDLVSISNPNSTSNDSGATVNPPQTN